VQSLKFCLIDAFVNLLNGEHNDCYSIAGVLG
jgi:hypothetical protein